MEKTWYELNGAQVAEKPAYRVAICGVPSSGKTTFATAWGGEIRNTDALIENGFEEAIEGVVGWLSAGDADVIEGAIVPHALRRWVQRNEGKPVDRVLWMGKAHEDLNEGQTAFGKGCRTVFEDVLPMLRDRGVRVIDLGGDDAGE